MASVNLPQTDSTLLFRAELIEEDDGLSTFTKVRSRLFGIACRMLRSTTEAEDIVQEVWLRWQATNRSVVENPPAFLATTTTRLCINLVKAARSRHEIDSGASYSEPVDLAASHCADVECREALRPALRLLIERLSPAERAAFILHEAFDYSYRKIASILEMQEVNIRQLVSRARKHICDGRCNPVPAQQEHRLCEVFLAASQKGEMAALEGLLSQPIVSWLGASGIVRVDDSRSLNVAA